MVQAVSHRASPQLGCALTDHPLAFVPPADAYMVPVLTCLNTGGIPYILLSNTVLQGISNKMYIYLLSFAWYGMRVFLPFYPQTIKF